MFNLLLTSNQQAVLVATFLVIFSVYFKTMYPWVSGGDSGELVGAACTASVAHPPVSTFLGI